MSETVQITATVPKDTVSALEAMAAAEERSRSAVIAKILRQAARDYRAAHAEAGRRTEGVRTGTPLPRAYSEDSEAR